MKSIFTNLITAAALLCTIGGALEAQTLAMQAKVPFAWQANGKTHKAGECRIAKEQNSKVISMRDANGENGEFLNVGPAGDKDPSPRLVFHRYGDRYFLAEVYLPGVSASQIPVSTAERKAISSVGNRRVVTILADLRRPVK